MAKILAKEFNVFYLACGSGNSEPEARDLESAGVKLIINHYDFRQNREPYNLVVLRPSLSEIIKQNQIHCVYTTVFAHYQFPINSIPAGIPLILISPFGHYASNGNVVKTYVSGRGNRGRIMSRGVKNVVCFFNPLTDYAPEILNKPPVGERVVFGRIGNSKDSSFDPIAIKAFKKLEELFGEKVKYIVVNPAPAWKEWAARLNVKNIEFRPTITEFNELSKFYGEIDVLAHVRKDGETVGIAIGEAMLAGNPILTHKSRFHNDHFDILDASYAKWCETGAAEKYFENMKWMVEYKGQIREMGKLARARALEIFSLEKQVPKILEDFHEACRHYYHNSFFGKLKGYARLYWENLKAMPFFAGKLLTYHFPGFYKFLRKLYYK